MGKTLTLPTWLSSSQVASAADVGTVADNGNGTIDVTNVKLSQVRAALGLTTYSLAALCQAPEVNGWAWQSPKTIAYDSVNMAFVFNSPTAEFSLGAFAAYDHQAVPPTIASNDKETFTTTLTGTIDVSSTAQLNAFDWPNEYIGGRLFNYVWVKVESTIDGVLGTYLAKALIGGTNGQVYATALNVEYKIPRKGTDTLTVYTYLGDSVEPLVKLTPAGQFPWTYTLKDGNPYWSVPDFDEATASGAGYNSAKAYSCDRNNATEYIYKDGTYSFETAIIEQDGGTVLYKASTTNEVYVNYTDAGGVARSQLVASNVPFKSDGTLQTITGTLTYNLQNGDDPIWVIKNAILN